jgi:hypothetical protein
MIEINRNANLAARLECWSARLSSSLGASLIPPKPASVLNARPFTVCQSARLAHKWKNRRIHELRKERHPASSPSTTTHREANAQQGLSISWRPWETKSVYSAVSVPALPGFGLHFGLQASFGLPVLRNITAEDGRSSALWLRPDHRSLAGDTPDTRRSLAVDKFQPPGGACRLRRDSSYKRELSLPSYCSFGGSPAISE